ncbi:MAG TPA: methyltransferase, partial [Armatimonadota bacterium]|nr:methyltransferase [Armatimonadota bacterium]
PLPLEGDVLDWGAGWGPIGTVIGALSPAAQVVMAEINERAAGLAQANADRNGALSVEVITGDALELAADRYFDVIVTNPPIHAGKKVIFNLIHDTRGRLRDGGDFWMVVRTRDGAKSYHALLDELYPHVERVAMRGGYRVLHASLPSV